MSSHMKFLWKNKILLECRTLITVYLFVILNQYLFLNEGISTSWVNDDVVPVH